MSARLVLVATPLGNMTDISARAITTLAEADVVACEDTRRTGRLLVHVGVTARRLVAVHEHNEAEMAATIVGLLRDGLTVALVSDAGMPVISDPGARVVRAAVDAGFDVSVVPGPSAAVAAVAVSGLASDRWVFEGFLPRKNRRRRVTEIAAETRTTVLYEAPHRVIDTLGELAVACGEERAIVLVRELTKLHEEIWRGTVAEALSMYATREPRGEYVIVLDGASPPEVSDAIISEALAEPGATAAGVAADLGVAKNRVYELAIRARRG